MPLVASPGVEGAVVLVCRTSRVSPKRKAIRWAVVKAVHFRSNVYTKNVSQHGPSVIVYDADG